MSSLRARLILATLLGTSVTILLCGLPIFFLVRDRMLSAADQSLTADARASVPAILAKLRSAERSAERDGPEWRGWPDRDGRRRGGLDHARHARNPGDERGAGADPGTSEPGERGRRGGRLLPIAPLDEDLAYLCWDSDGTVLLASDSLAGVELPRVGADLEALLLSEFDESLLRFSTINFSGQDSGLSDARAVSLRMTRRAGPSRRPRRGSGGLADDAGGVSTPAPHPLPEPAGEVVEIVLLRDASALGETLRYLASLLVAAWLLASLGAAGILTFFVRRGLRPLDVLRDQIANVDEDRLEHVFDVPGAPSELAPVVSQMNSLIHRMRASLEREQGFGANAAHELRTPLAGLRATLEVAAEHATDDDEHVEAERKCLAIVEQMQAMVETLLQLARSDSKRTLEPSEVGLAATVEAAWSNYSDRAAERGVQLDNQAPPDLRLHCDRALLTRLIDNVIENAVNYADAGSRVLVRSSAVDGVVRVEVANDASDAPPDLAERASVAFWRAEGARSDTGKHSGLGLTLCERITSALGGHLALAYEQGRFTVQLELSEVAG